MELGDHGKSVRVCMQRILGAAGVWGNRRVGSEVACLILLCLAGAPMAAQTPLSKAHRILLKRGIQTQAMVAPDSPFDLAVYRKANFTAVYWIWESRNSALGEAPGFPWQRWVSGQGLRVGLRKQPDRVTAWR